MSVKGKVNVFSRPSRTGSRGRRITNHQHLAGGSAAGHHGVFDPECTQKEVYEEVGKPVLKDVLQGYNGSILAYGQTSAGKTHSLLNSGMGMDGRPDPTVTPPRRRAFVLSAPTASTRTPWRRACCRFTTSR